MGLKGKTHQSSQSHSEIDEEEEARYAKGMSFVLHAPAKVNLRLEVLGKRSDGYHELRMIMVKLALADLIEGEITNEGMSLSSDHPEFPCDDRNILWKTWNLVQQESGKRFGLKLHVKKRIPLAGGLGGGSSDAGTLLGYLNQALSLDLTQNRLIQLGQKLGADVPLFLVPGRAYLAEGIGERLSPINLPKLCLVLANPGFPVSTAEIFGKFELEFPQNGCREDVSSGWEAGSSGNRAGRLAIRAAESDVDGSNPSRSRENLGKLQKFEGLTSKGPDVSHPLTCRGWREILPLLWNDLEAVTIDSYPAVGLVKKALHASGAKGVLMSGSGPTVFGIYSGQRAQEGASERLTAAYPEWWVCKTTTT